MNDLSNEQISTLEHSLKGDISKLVFTSENGDYSVIKIRTPEGEEQTVVGPFSGAFEGQSVEMLGIWEKHKEFGHQFRAKSVKFTLPKNPEGIKKYLASGLIPGIAKKLAECIVNQFGTNTLDILDNYSSRLLEVPGFGKKRLASIRDVWRENSAKREIFIFLQSLGISMTYAQKIFRFYGEKTPSIVKENPYRLADDIQGIGFIMSDKIAGSLGIDKTNIFRLASGIIYCLRRLSEEGHVCYPEEELLRYAGEILEVNEEYVKMGISEAITKGFISQISAPQECEFRNVFYLTQFDCAEKGVARAIKRIASAQKHKGNAIASIKSTPIISLNEAQKRAVEGVSKYSFSIITGGPGVGKTTVISEIVRLAKIAKLRVQLCAPTGRAAKRMSETCRHTAMTIHRILRWEPVKQSFVYNEQRPLNCDLLVVDEVSMLDIQLSYYLLRAVTSGTCVVMVGDADQLPSVGAGNFLADLIASGVAYATKLTQIYRQASGSRIISNAYLVNSGSMPDTTPVPKNISSDFYWVDSESPEAASDLIIKLVASRIPKRFGMNPLRDIQVLAPMNKGECGAIMLNRKLQEILNSDKHKKPQFRFGENIFRSGDRVMQISNNYDKSVFNGEMGRISFIEYEEKKFKVDFDGFQVEYDFLEADQLTLCYATTIHKAQGCEFPAVVVPILTQHYIMLRRNLIYTAITRAKRLLVLVGSKKALAIAIKNFHVAQRFSLLKERINQDYSKT